VVFVYIVPVLTAAASAVFLGESLVFAQVLGGAAVLAGVYVTTRGPRPEPLRDVPEPVASLPARATAK
jgi:drug/metabolite transporter (DMT)-like permease